MLLASVEGGSEQTSKMMTDTNIHVSVDTKAWPGCVVERGWQRLSRRYVVNTESCWPVWYQGITLVFFVFFLHYSVCRCQIIPKPVSSRNKVPARKRSDAVSQPSQSSKEEYLCSCSALLFFNICFGFRLLCFRQHNSQFDAGFMEENRLAWIDALAIPYADAADLSYYKPNCPYRIAELYWERNCLMIHCTALLQPTNGRLWDGY